MSAATGAENAQVRPAMTTTQHDAHFSAKPITTATWTGDTEILFEGVEVDVLAYDANSETVPARAACWIRYVWRVGGAPMYRSCDIADLEMTVEQYAALSTASIPPQAVDTGEEGERLRAAIHAIIEGDVPRTEGKKWREDGAYSKHDQCSHGIWMYEDCSECVAVFARAALEPQGKDDR